MPMNLIASNLNSEPPTLDDLEYWATTLGLTIPILADADAHTAQWYQRNAFAKFTVLIDRGMVIDRVGDGTIEDGIALLQ